MLAAWKEFRKGKRTKLDVLEFQSGLIQQVAHLLQELKNKTYRHGGYEHFRINDPKPRDIHKASVRDRLLHHAIYRALYPYFDKRFVHDSYSCRLGKGTHKAMDRFCAFAYKVSKNHTRTCWVLKCDIRKFFASIDHSVLFKILETHISDRDILRLLREVVSSFPQGLPLGNLTSQLLVNVYLNEFDQFVKHRLKAEYYIRYADDFVFLSSSKKELEDLLPPVIQKLDELKLHLHPDKISIKTFASGIDFLGWVHFPDHRVLRTASKRRMFRNLRGNPVPGAVESYHGMLKHGNTHKLRQKI